MNDVIKLAGAVKWDLQGVPAQSSGEQYDAAQVPRLLPLSENRQDRGPTAAAAVLGESEVVPGFHVAGAARVHAETLPLRHENPRRLRRLASAEVGRLVERVLTSVCGHWCRLLSYV